MKKSSKELTAIRTFLREEVEAGGLEPGSMQDVENSLIELHEAVRAGDLHMLKVAVNDIARKFVR